MTRLELIAVVVAMDDDDGRLQKIENMLLGRPEEEREPLMTLGEIGKAVRLGYSQLFRLGVPDRAADRTFGGRPRYKLSVVKAYLESPECKARRDSIRRAREERNKRKQAG
jgi:hypothetical protein